MDCKLWVEALRTFMLRMGHLVITFSVRNLLDNNIAYSKPATICSPVGTASESPMEVDAGGHV